MRKTRLFLLIAAAVWCGVVGQAPPSRQYLPADQNRGYPDRQYLPAVPDQVSNQFDDSRFDDEDSVSITSAAFGGARAASGISRGNGAPASSGRFGGRAPSSRFGSSVPSNQYGAPGASSRNGGAPSNQYGAPIAEGRLSNGASSRIGGATNAFSSPSALSRPDGSSNQIGGSGPSSRFGGPRPNTEYGVPGASGRSGTGQANQLGDSLVSSRFGGSPNQNGFPRTSSRFGSGSSTQNGAVGTANRLGGALSNQYDASSPSRRFGDGSSNFNAGPSPPSRFGSGSYDQNGASGTSGRFGGSPSYQYDAPGSNFGRGSGGYNIDEDSLSEPAHYQFSYEVEAREYGTEFGHEENRDDEFTRGSYHVLLPDGRTQIVEYEANQDGYKPQIRYQDGASARAGQGSGPY